MQAEDLGWWQLDAYFDFDTKEERRDYLMDRKLIATFLICSLLLYGALSLWRSHSVEQSIEEKTLLTEEDKEKILCSIREDEEAYLQTLPSKPYYSPYMDVFQDPQVKTFEINSHVKVKELELRYRTEYLPAVLAEDEVPLSPYMLFHTYGKLYSFDNLRLLISMGTSLSWSKLGPYLEDDMFSRLAMTIETWEANGGKKEGDWFQEFQKSPEYAVFVDSVLREIGSPEPTKSIDEMVMEIQNIPIESTLSPSNPIKSHFLMDAKALTSMIYVDYQEHVQNEDFVSACIDAGAIDSIWRRANYVKTISFWQYHEIVESNLLPDPTVDIMMVLGDALAITLAITYTTRH